MKVYRVSPIVKYSPFYNLTYFSKLDFCVGDICEIDFNNKKVYALITSVMSLNDAKVEIRKGNFQTKKIETKLTKELEKFLEGSKFGWLQKFACKFLQPEGEVFYAMFGDPRNLFEKSTKKVSVEEKVSIFPDKLSYFGKKVGLSGKRIFEYLENVRRDKLLSKIQEIEFNEFELEKYIDYQSPNLSFVHLLLLYLEIFSESFSPDLTFRSSFFGVSEQFFIQALDHKKNISKNVSTARKYLYKIKDDENCFDSEILKAIKDDKTFVFVLNNTFETVIFCKDCKKPYKCEICDYNFSILNEENDGISKRFLFCKNCTNKKPLKEDQYLICKSCGSWGLFPHGAGSQKIYSQLLNNFKKEDVVFIDESEKRLSEKKITQIIENFSKDEKKILLGTIRSLKVIRNIFSERNQKIKVVVLSLGKIAFGKSFESQEKYINLLASLENVASAIYLRKLEKEKDILENFKNQENFLKIETEMRKIFLLPPYRKVLSICFPVHTKKALDKYLEKFFANIYLQTQKGKYCYYHLLLSEEEIFKNNFYFEQLRNFGKFVVSDHIYENFLLKKS